MSWLYSYIYIISFRELTLIINDTFELEIFYTTTYYGKGKYQNYYDLVLNTLEAFGLSVISPEKDNYLDLLSKKEKLLYKDPMLKHYMAIIKGIPCAISRSFSIAYCLYTQSGKSTFFTL